MSKELDKPNNTHINRKISDDEIAFLRRTIYLDVKDQVAEYYIKWAIRIGAIFAIVAPVLGNFIVLQFIENNTRNLVDKATQSTARRFEEAAEQRMESLYRTDERETERSLRTTSNLREEISEFTEKRDSIENLIIELSEKSEEAEKILQEIRRKRQELENPN